MANQSIKDAFVRMYQHIVVALGDKADKTMATETTSGLMHYSDKQKLNRSVTDVTVEGASILESGVAAIPTASTSAYGVTKLSNSVTSTSKVLAASAYAVKQAYACGDDAYYYAEEAYLYADEANSLAAAALPKSGGTLTGPLTLNGDPTSNLQPATKQYVDNLLGDIESVLASL